MSAKRFGTTKLKSPSKAGKQKRLAKTGALSPVPIDRRLPQRLLPPKVLPPSVLAARRMSLDIAEHFEPSPPADPPEAQSESPASPDWMGARDAAATKAVVDGKLDKITSDDPKGTKLDPVLTKLGAPEWNGPYEEILIPVKGARLENGDRTFEVQLGDSATFVRGTIEGHKVDRARQAILVLHMPVLDPSPNKD